MDRQRLVADYYRCLDDHDYRQLRDLLHPEFVQYRPDRRFTDREQFVQFMESGRPMTDTTHEITAMGESAESYAVYGKLYDADGTLLFEFIDVFEFDAAGRITTLRTHS